MGRSTCSPVQEMIWSCVYWLFEFLFNLAFLCSWVSTGWGCVVLDNFLKICKPRTLAATTSLTLWQETTFAVCLIPLSWSQPFHCVCALAFSSLSSLTPPPSSHLPASFLPPDGRSHKLKYLVPSWPAVKYFFSHTSVKNVLRSHILINVILYQHHLIVPWTAAISQKTFCKLSVIALDSFVGGKTGDI